MALTKFEKLEQKAYDQNIGVYNYHFSETKKGACMIADDTNAILLDNSAIKSSAEKLCILSEEIGHFETGTIYLCQEFIPESLRKANIRRAERRSKQWAYENILNPELIQEALDDCCVTDYEVANYCEVTVEFLHEAVEYYKEKGITFYSKCYST